jgi:hypothetical protein
MSEPVCRTIPPAFLPEEPNDERKLDLAWAPTPAPSHWTFTEQLPDRMYGLVPEAMFQITWETWREAPAALRADYQDAFNVWSRKQLALERRVYRYLDVTFARFVWAAFAAVTV